MNDSSQMGCALRNDDDTPNLAAMRGEIFHSITHSIRVVEKNLRNDNTVYARWEGQQDDGRKPDTIAGKEAQPWPRASDVRIRLADELVNDQVKMMKAAARTGQIAFTATRGASFEAAGKTRSYLNWLRNTRMRKNVRRETKLAARWRQVYGTAAMGVTWHQEWAREYQKVTAENLQELAAAEPGGVASQILAGLYEPDRDVKRQLAGILRQMYEDLDQGEALKQLNALQRTGEMTMPARYLRKNEPRWKALKWWVDAFGPLNMGEVQESPWFARRVVLTRAQAEEKKISEKWSEEFVEKLAGTAGHSMLDWLGHNTALTAEQQWVFADSAELMDGLIEVLYFYYRHADEDGVPCIYLTVMSPHVQTDEAGDPLYGLDQPYGYDHGDYPVVMHQREAEEEQVHETRGTPETVMTQQTEVKAMRDARVNQTELFLQPPVIRPEREIGLSLTIRPRGEIGERRAQSTRQWTVPNTAPAGQPLEQDARTDAYRYFARNRTEDPVRAGLYDQDLAADWCEELEECWSQTLQLAQQFEDEQTFDRIVGGAQVPLHVTRDEIQGEFGIQLKFNTDALDPDRMEKKANLVQTVLAPLAGGTIDLGAFVRGMAEYFFPEFAEDMIRSGPQAAQAEIDDEKNNWSQMMAGTEPIMVESGQNFAMRLQWLEQQIAQPGSVKRLALNPDSAELVSNRLQHLQFQVQQSTVNAQTGRVGVEAGPTAA